MKRKAVSSDNKGMSPWQRILEQPQCRGHFVQLYDNGSIALAENVALYLKEGLRQGDAVLVIATPENWQGIFQELVHSGADIPQMLETNQLVVLDASETLANLLVDGQPDWGKMEEMAARWMRLARPTRSGGGFRAYGEMVNLLWKARQFAAAVRLEQLWNRLLEHSSFSLYCSYAIDLFDSSIPASAVEGILGTHSHLLPTGGSGNLKLAVILAIHDVMGPDAAAVWSTAKKAPSAVIMPDAEAMILGVRANVPEHADQILSRCRYHHQVLSAA